MPPDPDMPVDLYGEDPYVAWARAQQGPVDPPPQDVGPQGPIATDSPYDQPAIADGSPYAGPDPYAAAMQLQQPDVITGAAPAADAGDVLGHTATIHTEPGGVVEPQPSDAGYLDWAKGKADASPYTAAPEPWLTQEAAPQVPEVLPSEHDAILADATGKAVAAMPADQFAKFKADYQGAQIAKQAELEHVTNLANMQLAKQDLDMHKAAIAKADADTRDLMARANELANTRVDPDRFRKNRGLVSTVLGFLAVAVGGAMSQYTGGKNLALEQLNRSIDADIDAQKHDIANARLAVGMGKGAIADELERHGDLYRAQETYRVATLEAAKNDLQSQLQKFDPASSTAIRGRDTLDQLHAAQQQAVQKAHETFFKNSLDTAKEDRERAAQQATALHMQNEDAIAAAKAAGAGAGVSADKGSPTSPNYTVPTGLFDPETKSPVLGKLALPKPAAEAAQADLNSYHDEQLAWKKLATIAQRMDGHRGSAGQISDRFKTTDEKEYEQARGALMAVKLKALGERPNQNSIDAQEALVPKLTEAFGAKDTQKIIADSQADNDARFAGHMNTIGLDPSPIIGAAQRSRALDVRPGAADEVTNANDAVAAARTPAERKDALEAVELAKQRTTAQAVEQQRAAAAITAASTMTPIPLVDVDPAFPPKVQAHFVTSNDAIDTYNQRLAKYHALITAKKKPTPEAQNNAALKLLDAKEAIDTIRAAAPASDLDLSGQPYHPTMTKFR